MIDRNLFIYLTKRAGKTLQDVADAWNVPISGVYKRINGDVELRRSEMECWMLLVGVRDAGPIFFPAFVADSQHSAVPAVSEAYGG